MAFCDNSIVMDKNVVIGYNISQVTTCYVWKKGQKVEISPKLKAHENLQKHYGAEIAIADFMLKNPGK